MATTSPNPFPESGRRTLSARESMQRMSALACTVPADNKPRCSGQIFVGVFFDGTGNNMKADYETPPPDQRKHTNVVRLFQAFRDEPRRGYLRYYIPGVGTSFPEIGEDEPSTFGGKMAKYGEDRIIWGLLRVLNAPYQYVFDAPLIPNDRASVITANMASSTNPPAMRRAVLQTWQDKLRAALQGQKPRVEQINLSVFGFSRGAAQARTFVNWLYEVCKEEGGGHTFAGIPIRVQFLGIFDTVASVGLANLFDTGTLAGHQSWADNTQQIHPAVEQCVHFVAGHEVRACFPLDSVRVKTSYPGNAMEVMYPGAHSDVGGGYAPGALGISLTTDSFMSVIPGVNMYHEAVRAGVPLQAFSELKKEFQDALTPASTTIADFNAYIRDAQIGSGSAETLHRRHMTHYFNYRFKHRATFEQVSPYLTASSSKKGKDAFPDREALKMTQAHLLRRLSLGIVSPTATDWTPAQAADLHQKMSKASGLKARPEDERVYEIAANMSHSQLTPAIENFCGKYVHDSMAGFINFGMDEYANNKLGLAKYRTIFKGND